LDKEEIYPPDFGRRGIFWLFRNCRESTVIASPAFFAGRGNPGGLQELTGLLRRSAPRNDGIFPAIPEEPIFSHAPSRE